MTATMLSKAERRFYSFQRDYWAARNNARSYDHPIVHFFGEQRIHYLAKKIDFSEIQSAIEIGAGDGFGTYQMGRLVETTIATDLSLQMLKNNPAQRGLKIMSSAEVAPFATNSADLVYCWELLHHVSSVQTALAEMGRISRRYVILFEPNRNHPAQFLFSLLKKSERGGMKFSKRYLRRVCAAAGLEILHIESVGCIFPNVTPAWSFPFLKRLAFVRPLTGISNVVVAQKRNC